MEKIDYQIDRKHNGRIHKPVKRERIISAFCDLKLFSIILLLSLLSRHQLRADTVYSSGSGNWYETATWEGGTVPSKNSQVIILSNHIVTVDQPVDVNSLNIRANAELILNQNISISIIESDPTALTVEAGATLDARTFMVEGSGGFILQNGGTLKTSHPEGISTVANTGCIRTNIRQFGNAAIYHYTGSGNQSSGDALPMVADSKVIIVELAGNEFEFIINTSSVVQIAADGRLEIRYGTMVEGDTGGQGRSVEGAGMLVMKGGVFKSERTNSETTTVDFPRLTGNYSNGTGGPMLGTIVLAGIDNYQRLKSGRTYNNLIFNGEGTKRIPNATHDINGTVTIYGGVVDARSFTFGKEKTNLTMTGGRLITSSTGQSPDMGGAYNLTGGTIEFANTSATSQTIRGADLQYFNIDITGNSVANSNGQIKIQAGGTFTIKGGGIFRFNAHFISGGGSFRMENNSTLLIGSPYGIKLSGESTTDGNIRVSGNRVFSSLANYGFIGSDNQVTGNALPSTVNRLILDKESSSIITLSQDITVSAELILNRGVLVTGVHELYLSNPSAVSLIAGAANNDFKNSFIRGALKRQVSVTNANYYFPIGRSDAPFTATVNFNPEQLIGTEPMTLRAEFLPPPSDYFGDLPKEMAGVQVNNLSDAGFWQIVSQNITTANYSLSLSTGGSVAIPYPEGIRIVKRNQGETNWEMAGETPTYSGTSPDLTFSQQNINGFSEFAMGGDVHDNPLPVEWLSMDVSQSKGIVYINWQTATETNNHYFSVLRAADGSSFQLLGQVTGAGNSSRANSYSWSDHNPLPGIGYYQIMQTDFDGSNSYSKVIAWQNQTTNEPAILIQNQQIHFQIPDPGHTSWSYQIYSISGIILSSGEIPSGSTRMVDASALNNPLLLIVMTDGNVSIRKKVMVK